MPLRILLLNQYYPPGLAPTGRVLHDLASVLVSRGHEVHVVCSRQEYSGGPVGAPSAALDGVTVKRVPALGYGRRSKLGRVLDYASYIVLAFAECLTRWRPDVVVALTTPPYLGLMARGAAALRGAALVHWVMDVYPDSMVADGMVSADGLTVRLLKALTRMQFRGARGILVLGDFMAARMRRYVVSGELTAVPLWSLGAAVSVEPERVARVRAERGWKESDLVLLYSGNMGRGHSFTTFLAGAERLGPRGPVWAFAGDGHRRTEIEEFVRAHPQARIQLLPYVPAERLSESQVAADVHLVSLAEAWDGVMVPSKLQGAFAVGRPALFVGGRGNEVASWIAESGGGWVVDEGNVEGLIRAVDEARDPVERTRRGKAALVFARERFDQATNCARIAGLIEGLAKA